MGLYKKTTFSSKILVFTLLILILESPYLFGQVLINEIQTTNNFTFSDEYKNYDDWIELYNSSSAPVSIKDFGLTDDSTDLYKFRFPDLNIPGNGYVIVFASGSEKTEINTHWETAVSASDSWNYRANTSAPPLANPDWRNLGFTGSWSSGTGGIGFGDSDDGTSVSVCASVYMRKTFTIPDTSKILEAVLNMDYDDGFVAYLNGIEIARVNVGIKGVPPNWNDIAPAAHEAVMYQGLSPDSFHIDKDFLRSVLKNGTNVLCVETHNQTASNSDLTSRPWLSFSLLNGSSFFNTTPAWFKNPPILYLHADFKLSRTGETVCLTNNSGQITDRKYTGVIEADNSIVRNPDGAASWCLAGTPTPGTSNNSGTCVNAYASVPVFSLTPGFYFTQKLLSLTTSYPGGVIRYSLDGSEVTSSSTLYSGQIHLDTTLTVRARVFSPTALASPTVTNTYFINLTCKLPVYALTTDPLNLWDYYSGIYVLGPNAQASNPHFGANYWQDWEKPATIEFYDRDKQRAFKFNSGIKITGGWSRSANQKSIEVMLGDRYGSSSLNYPVISTKPYITEWNDFIFHDMGNDRGVCHMRDPLMERVLSPTHVDYVAYEPCLLYVNGQKWGVYYSRENDDHNFIWHNYGYKGSEVDLLKESYFYPTVEVKKGNDSAFWAMYQYAMGTSTTDTAFYPAMNRMMDLENMVDYFIAETYYPNNDWMGGGNNNLKLWRPRKSDGRFRYISYDLDFGLGLYGDLTTDMLATALNPSPHNYNADIFKKLTQNPQFKRYFINRYADLINTIFLPQNIQSMAYLYRDSLRKDMHFQYEKWGGGDTNTWLSEISDLITFANQRPANVRNHIQTDFSLTSKVTLTLNVSPAGAGRIEISTISPQSYPWSGVYFNGNPVTITAIPNPGYTFDHWRSNVAISSNDLNRSTTYNFTSNDQITCYFSGSPAPVQLTFSEINYNSDSASNAGDWIEIHNRSASAINLSNYKFRDSQDNHTFQIPLQTEIAGGGYLVLATSLEKFNQVNPSVTNVIGGFNFDFSNGGEMLRLFDYRDSLIVSAEYSDNLPWPQSADGGGYTLELNDPAQSLDDGSNWFAGCLNGSPGRAYATAAVSISNTSSTTGCLGNAVGLLASGTAATYQWQRNHVDIPGADSLYYPAVQSGSYTLRVSVNGCSSFSDSIVVSLIPPAIVDSVSPASRCGSGSLTLSASSTSALQWYADSTGGSSLHSGSNFSTPVISNSQTYYVQAVGACPSARIPVQATVNEISATPVALDQERCGTGTVTLTVPDTTGIHWYSSASSGTSLGLGNLFTSPVISQTTTYYVQAVSICSSPRVPVVARVNPVAAVPVAADVSQCGPGTFVLTASDTSGSIRWYDSAAAGSLLFTGSGFTTPFLSADHTYFVEAGSVCPSIRIPVHAFVLAATSDPLVNSSMICGGGSVTLSATSAATINWYDMPGGTLLGTGLSFATPAISQTTTFYARAGTQCPGNYIPVEAVVIPLTADPAVTGDSHCGSGSMTLLGIDTAIVTWYDAPGGTVLGTGSSFNTPVISQTTTYYAQAGAQCRSNFIPVEAIVNPVAADPVVAGGSRCGSGALTLLASDTSLVTWYDSPGGTALGTGLNFITPIINQSTTYYARAGIQCPGNFISVEATINPLPADPVANDASNCGPGVMTLQASDTTQISWYDAPGGNLLGTGTSFTTPVLSASTVYYAVAGVVCYSSPVAVQATIHSLPLPDLGNDTIIESGNPLTLNPGIFSSYLWASGETTPDLFVFSSGIYGVTVTDGNGCSGYDEIAVSVTTGTGSLPGETFVEIFPNPANAHCRITIPDDHDVQVVQLVNVEGQILFSQHPDKGTNRMIDLDLNGFAKGIYLIRMISSTTEESYRLFIQ